MEYEIKSDIVCRVGDILYWNTAHQCITINAVNFSSRTANTLLGVCSEAPNNGSVRVMTNTHFGSSMFGISASEIDRIAEPSEPEIKIKKREYYLDEDRFSEIE